MSDLQQKPRRSGDYASVNIAGVFDELAAGPSVWQSVKAMGRAVSNIIWAAGPRL